MLKLKYLAAVFIVIAAVLAAGCTGTESSGTNTVQNPASSGNDAAETGDTVNIWYTGTLDDGTVFDSNVGKTPLTFAIDDGTMIKGFNSAVKGMKTGETKKVHLMPDEAYGAYNNDLVIEYDKSLFGDEADEYSAGDKVYLNTGMNIMPAVILEITDEKVKLDFNSELAGKELNFEITVDSIQKK